QTTLQEVPGGEAALFLAALRVRLIAAEKNVAPRDRHADAVGNLREAGGCILHYSNATTKTRSHEENNFFRSSSCFRVFVVAFSGKYGARLPPSLKLGRTAVALAEAGLAGLKGLRHYRLVKTA